MEEKNNTNNNTDDDIQECKADILRASGESDGAPIELDEDEDINIFEDDDLDDGSFEITLEDSEVGIDDSDKTKTAEVKPKPEHVVPKLDLSKRILVNERQAAASRRQRAGGGSEKKTPAAAAPKNIIPEATGSMGALLNEAKRKRGGAVNQSETKASEKPVAATKKKIPIVELPRRTIKNVKITSEPVIKQPFFVRETNDLQDQIISEIVAKDLARFCGEI
jgi:hypothetical protein